MEFLLPALVSLLLTVLVVPLTIKLAHKYKLLNYPDNHHPANVQNRIIPRAGGLPPFVGIVLSLLLFVPFSKSILGIILGLGFLLIVGLADDRYKNFSPYARLLTQFLVALIVVGSGIGITYTTNPFGGLIRFDSTILSFDLFGLHQIILWADLLALVWIVWVMNMINWSKGVDGQMPGIVLVATTILGFLSLKFGVQDPTQLTVAKIAFITAGASLGLLIFNWHPAKILPAFSGSTIFGFMIAVLAILSGAKLATAGLVLLIPATDFIYIFVRRILQGKSPVWGDRGHLHHKLLDAGLTHPQIALFYISLSAILGAAALSLNSRGKLFAAVLVGTVALGSILWLNYFGGFSKRPDRDNG